MKEKLLQLLKKYKYYLIGALVLLAIIITVIAIIAGGGKNDEDDVKWGDGISKGIPRFDVKGETVVSGDGYLTAYYKNVSGDSIDAYVEKLEATLKIDFGGDIYPRTAIYGDKIITLHYNVTEMKFSVTVTKIN